MMALQTVFLLAIVLLCEGRSANVGAIDFDSYLVRALLRQRI